jgi:hypothetical protein
MITFRKFLVEKIVGNAGWVYHRTKNDPEESDIVTHGIKPSTNQSAMYGRGLYCCYDFDQQLKSQMEMYGDYIIKGKVDLNNFAILDENVYRLANPRGDFEKHLKDIGTNMNSVKHNIPYTSRTARIIWKKCKESGYNGIVFTGETDGKVVVIWNRRNFIPFQYTMDDGINWIKLTPNIESIKRPHDKEYDKDDEKISYSKILKELSNKEVIGDVYPPVDYYDNIILKNVIKCGRISSRNSRGIDAPNLIESDDILFIEAEKVNLPKLEKSKVIEFQNLLEKLSLPELKLADDIISRKVYEIDFPKLRNLNDGITAHRCEYVNMPELTYCGHGGLFLPESHKINLQKLRVCGGTITISPLEVDLPELIECENFTAPKSVTINLPKLRQAFGSLEFTKANEINLPELKYCELLDAHYARKVNLINLEELTTTVIEGIGIHMNYIEELYLPKLKICRFFNTPNLKKLTISKSFKNLEKIKEYLPRDCEIIFSEDTPQIKVDENVTFKKYLMLKEKTNLLNEWTREMMPKVYDALEKYDDPMVGIHFSKGVPYDRDNNRKAPHIGITVNPFHNDPIGIYAFPKDYVLGGKLEKNAGFREFVNYYIVKPSSRANILNLSTMSEQDAIDILKKMGIGENAYRNQNIYHKSGKMDVGHRFWGTLEVMRKQIYGEHSKNVSWNNLFKKTGYNVLYDDGNGIIHTNEPNQIIYLESSAMEILEQGTQDDPRNKIYSFFIKQFPELRAEKSKDYWDAKVLKLVSNKGYELIILLPDRIDEYSKMRVNIKDTNLGKSEPLDEFEMNGNLEDFVIGLKEKISKVENEYVKQSEPPVPPVLENISKRFNIKLKRMKIGDWEIRQRYQDADKDYVITFYIRTYKENIFFILEKKQQGAGYNTFGYKENATVVNRERYTPEDIVKSGLEILENQRYGSISINHSAMKTIEFLRKKVFKL